MDLTSFNEFVSLDIETTGLSAARDKIIEIGAVKVKDGKIIDHFKSFINPGISIPHQITRITGITDMMVKDAPSVAYVLPQFLSFAENIPIVAHNASFDMGFIRYFAKVLGLKVSNPVICTLQLSRKVFTGLENHKLDTVARYTGVKLENHHRAVDDSMAAALIYLKCMEVMKGAG